MTEAKISEIVVDSAEQLDSKLSKVTLNDDDVDEIEKGIDSLQSRGERKARKALAKLGLKKINGISRVTMRRFKTQHFFVIANAEVYKSPNSNCYIVFGEARTEDAAAGLSNLTGGNHQSNNHSNQIQNPFQPEMMMHNSSAGKQAVQDDNEDDGEEDETGIDPADVSLLLSQVSCSRAKAVRALKAHNGDLINAIIAAS